MQTAKLGDYQISRLICAGNPFGGWTHGGDLVCLGRLFREYFTDEKIADTLQLCTANRINTALIETEDNILRSLDLYEKKWDIGYNGSVKFRPINKVGNQLKKRLIVKKSENRI